MEKIIVKTLDNLTQATGAWELTASGTLTDGGSGMPITATASSATFLTFDQWRDALVQAFIDKALSDFSVSVDQVLIPSFTIETV